MNELTKDLAVKVDDTVAQAKAMTITDDTTLDAAARFLVVIKTLAKQVKEHYGPAKKAADAAKQALLDAERTHLNPLVQAEALVKPKVDAYMTAKAAAERKAQEEAKLAMAQTLTDAGAADMADAVLDQPVQVAKQKVEGISTRVAYKFRVVDVTKVPREYMMVDEKMVGGVVRAMGKLTAIPGIEVFEENVVSVRSLKP